MDIKEIDWDAIVEAVAESDLSENSYPKVGNTWMRDDTTVAEIVYFIKGEIEKQNG